MIRKLRQGEVGEKRGERWEEEGEGGRRKGETERRKPEVSLEVPSFDAFSILMAFADGRVHFLLRFILLVYRGLTNDG